MEIDCELLIEKNTIYRFNKGYVDYWQGVGSFYSALVKGGNVVNTFWKPICFCLNSLRIKTTKICGYRKCLCEFYDANGQRGFVVLHLEFIFRHLEEA